MKEFVSVLVLVLISVERTFAVTCPVGATEYNGNCFIASKEPGKFQHAQMFCYNYGCKVAIPYSAKVSDIQGFGQANSLTQVVFAVTDALEERDWVADGQAFTDVSWASGKPSTSRNNNCIRVNDLSVWEMTDVSCNGKHNFICECDPLD